MKYQDNNVLLFNANPFQACCQCDAKYTDPPIRCRFAEKLAARYFKDEDEK